MPQFEFDKLLMLMIGQIGPSIPNLHQLFLMNIVVYILTLLKPQIHNHRPTVVIIFLHKFITQHPNKLPPQNRFLSLASKIL